MLWLGLSALGLFGSIYHPVGIAWLTRDPQGRGWMLGVNGMIGNLSIGLSPVIAGVPHRRLLVASCLHPAWRPLPSHGFRDGLGMAAGIFQWWKADLRVCAKRGRPERDAPRDDPVGYRGCLHGDRVQCHIGCAAEIRCRLRAGSHGRRHDPFGARRGADLPGRRGGPAVERMAFRPASGKANLHHLLDSADLRSRGSRAGRPARRRSHWRSSPSPAASHRCPRKT